MNIQHYYKIFISIFFLFTIPKIAAQEIVKSIYLTANTWDVNDTQVISKIANDAKSVQDPLVLILGNAVPKGEFNNSVERQLNLIKDFKDKAIFVSGNHEWYKNLDRRFAIEKFIQKNSQAKFYPDHGEPIKTKDISENVVLITVDSKWYLANWNDYTYINNLSEIQNRTSFFTEFEDQIKKAQGKIALIAIHHPIETNTKQGILANTGGFSPQNFQNTQYRQLRNRLKAVARASDNIIFISGHDKNLQYLNKKVPQIISGAAGKTQSVKKGEDGSFTTAEKGYVRLDVDADGKVLANYFTIENNTSKQVFSTTVLKGTAIENRAKYEKNVKFPNTKAASVYTKEATTKSGFYKAFWGKHYRKYYGIDVNATVVMLDTLMGGLSPIKRGGGQQSKSLRLEGSNGQQFVMRALKKSTIKFLQANAFPDAYIGDLLDDTTIDKFLADFYTTAHPYTSFAISDLSKAIGVNHTNPKLYYIPKQPVLGIYNEEYGDELYMIEEHVGDSQLGLASFGNPIDIVNTTDVLAEIHKSGKSKVDEPAYIRARLFDMLIGDWDRHEDQWRWALFKNENGTEYYKPIPRDRDQAFSKYDGTLISIFTRTIPALRKMQSYDVDLRSEKWFASSPYHLDLSLINDSEWEEWVEQVQHIQKEMTDSKIEAAFEGIPLEIKGKTINDIKIKLRGRRDNLMKIADNYFNYLNKFEVIAGTQKADDFKIRRLADGKTNIEVLRDNNRILNHTFTRDLTKEIWIYGLDGKDSFVVDGNGDQLIKIKVIGGKENDTYDFKNTNKIKLYDYKSKKNTIINKRSKKWLVDDYFINNYDHRKVKYNINQILPLIAYNPDDGIELGVLNIFTQNGLQRNPFSYQHAINAAYYTATSGFEMSYKGEFSNIFNHWNFGIEGAYSSPKFTENFFGFGNQSTYDKESQDLDFHRTRIRKWNAAISLHHRNINGGHFEFKPLVESFNVENSQGRFVSFLPSENPIFDRQIYGGAEANYRYENKNSSAFPTLGLMLGLTTGYKTNLNKDLVDNSFAYLTPEIAINHKLNKGGSLVFATKLNGNLIFGDNFEFYHAATIGGNNGLRGFRNERFTGKQSFFQNTDLRLALGGLRTSIIPIRFGITGSFDYGRVWVQNDTSGRLHNSYGGSIWLVGAEAFTANFGYFNSLDGGRLVFTLGFDF